MTHVRIKGFKVFTDRYGKRRCYHRATGTPIDLEKFPFGSEAFLAECGRIAKPELKPTSGTWKALVTEFRASPSFCSLRPKTREFYEGALEWLRPIDDTFTAEFSRGLVVRIRDKALEKRGWHFANRVTTTISAVFSWAIDRGRANDNPASEIKRIPRPKNLDRANRPWTDRERYSVLMASPPHIRVPIGLMMFLGMDPIDAISVTKAQLQGSTLRYNRRKTGEETVRTLPSLLRVILRGHRHDAVTVAATAAGTPWTKSGLDSSWFKIKNRLVNEGKIAKGLTLKGLRHTHATILGEMGMDDRTIGDALAQSTEGMARWYSRDADRSKKLETVTHKYDAEERQRRKKLSNSSKKLSNPDLKKSR